MSRECALIATAVAGAAAALAFRAGQLAAKANCDRRTRH